MKRTHASLARFGWQIILVNTALSFILGTLAALVGGPLTPLGGGVGGGYGIPELVFLLAALLGIPGLILAVRGMLARDREQAEWTLVFVGPLVISFAFIQIAHTIDPCVVGLWDLSSRMGETIPLCERFGSEINIHTRFHYFMHILLTLPLIWFYGKALDNRLPGIFAK